MRKIVNKTYRNFLLVLKEIQKKGYEKDEAERLAHKIFANYSPNGKSIEALINDILPHSEYIKMYGEKNNI